MATWRLRFLLLIVFLSLLGLIACDRPLGDSGTLPTIVPTVALGGEDGDPEVGGGQGEDAGPTAAPYPEPTEVAETTPRETAEPEDGEPVEPVAAASPILSPTPAAESEMEEETTEETTGETAEADAAASDEVATDAVGDEATDDEAAAVESSPAADQNTAAAATQATVPQTHTVAPGENLYRIGLRYGLSWAAIAQANGLTDANRITVGQVLTIPTGATPGTGGQPTPSPQTETTHTVRPGDNLFRIGLAYGVGWIQVAEANGLVSPGQIVVGQVLKIPVNRPGPMPEFTHQVRPGESLLRIALLYGIPWTTIAQANNLSSPYVIYPGQALVIPGQ